jgi:rubrerythrin
VIDDANSLSDEQKQVMLRRCLELAIEGETYEYTTMYPEFAAQARQDRDSGAEAEFAEQSSESKEHAGTFRTAAKNFGLLTPIEQHHAATYGVALDALQGKGTAGHAEQPIPGKWICKVCSMIYGPVAGDPDSGIAPGTPFEQIPDDWRCPICGANKANFYSLSRGRIETSLKPLPEGMRYFNEITQQHRTTEQSRYHRGG